MRKSARYALLTTVAILVVAAIAVPVVSWKAGQSLLHPERKHDPRTPTNASLSWSWANFTTSDNVPLVGWWMPADATPADNATVIFVHGYGDSKAQGLPVYPFLHNLSVNVLAFDTRADGFSGGAYTTAGLLETRDVDAALDWLKRQPGFSQDPRVVLFGWSAGGATVLRSAPDRPDVDAVISDASFSRLQHIVDSSIGEFTNLPRWPFGPLAARFAGWSVGLNLNDDAPVESIPRIHVPILLIQGLNDTIVTPDQVDELAKAATGVPSSFGSVQVLKVPGAKHVKDYATAPTVYEQKVGAFLRAALPDARLRPA